MIETKPGSRTGAAASRKPPPKPQGAREKFGSFLQSSGGKVSVVVVSLAAAFLAYWAIRSFLHGDTPGDPNLTAYVCSETGKTFMHRNVVGESFPILSPYSGKETGYPAEPCFWKADGGTKTEPTWVLLNSAVGKPGPTFCPDCGRLVIGRNPPPVPGGRPPPTQKEYAARHPQYQPVPSRDDRR